MILITYNMVSAVAKNEYEKPNSVAQQEVVLDKHPLPLLPFNKNRR